MICGTEKLKRLQDKAEQLQLEGADFLHEYDMVELAVIYNGIGPDRFPDWLRQAVTRSAELFEPAALIHDLEYFIGGDETDFTAANERFRRNCGRLVKAEYPWWSPLRYAWLNRARRWANYCQAFGRAGYNFREKEDGGIRNEEF